jgi:adenylyl-sulfate kinase
VSGEDDHLHPHPERHTDALRHHIGATVWLTGFSGSGKSTIGDALVDRLHDEGYDHFRLDGDDLRDGLCTDLGFSPEDRAENVRRIGEVALLFALRGHLAVVSAISPYAAGRDSVRARHEAHRAPFLEVHVATPVEICEARDPKGLYRKARTGEIESFTGISGPYEVPVAPEAVLDTTLSAASDCADQLFDILVARGLLVDVSDRATRH